MHTHFYFKLRQQPMHMLVWDFTTLIKVAIRLITWLIRNHLNTLYVNLFSYILSAWFLIHTILFKVRENFLLSLNLCTHNRAKERAEVGKFYYIILEKTSKQCHPSFSVPKKFICYYNKFSILVIYMRCMFSKWDYVEISYHFTMNRLSCSNPDQYPMI